ncbi:MAG: glycosyltransferase family 2 protein [Planctomycetota bacterium]
MALPEVDVLLPVHKARRTLPYALADVLAQRGVAVRVLAVLDRPRAGEVDDGTAEWLEHAARREPRIVVLPGPGAGLAAALQLGLEAVRAPLLAHMEADDRSAPDRLARLHAALTQSPAPGPAERVLDAVVCRAAQFGARSPGMRRYLDWQNALLSHEDMARERFVEIPALHQTGLYRTAAVRACGGYLAASRDEKHAASRVAWPADIDFWMRWFEGGDEQGREAGGRVLRRVVKLPRVLYRWRQHASQQTRGGGSHSLATLRACKAHYLARHLGVSRSGATGGTGPSAEISSRASHRQRRDVAFLSTGQTLVDWEAALAAVGVRPVLAREWRPGRPLPAQALPETGVPRGPQGPLLLAAYGSPVARERLRAALAAALGRPAREPQELLFTA